MYKKNQILEFIARKLQVLETFEDGSAALGNFEFLTSDKFSAKQMAVLGIVPMRRTIDGKTYDAFCPSSRTVKDFKAHAGKVLLCRSDMLPVRFDERGVLWYYTGLVWSQARSDQALAYEKVWAELKEIEES